MRREEGVAESIKNGRFKTEGRWGSWSHSSCIRRQGAEISFKLDVKQECEPDAPSVKVEGITGAWHSGGIHAIGCADSWRCSIVEHSSVQESVA